MTSGLVASIVLLALVAGCAKPAELGGQRSEVIPLDWRPATAKVTCDGTTRTAGTVTGARPGERIEITTPLPVEVDPGVADDAGDWELEWTCGPEEASLRWDLTATGAESGRTVPLTLIGTAEIPERERVLEVSLERGAAICDGSRRVIGVIVGAEAGELVRFVSPDTSNLVSGRADQSGTLELRWDCGPTEADLRWEVTATGDQSGRSASFTVTGTLPDLDASPVRVTLIDEAVSCDGERHEAARLDGFLAGEVVALAEVGGPVDGLRPGTADADGTVVVNWQCRGADVGREWRIVAAGEVSAKTVTMTITGGGEPARLDVETIETPFVCDGQRRPVAVISGLRVGEYVDFSSPQVDGPLREGRAVDGSVTVNWRCDPTEAVDGKPPVWSMTATGRESGAAITFEIVGTVP